MSIHLEHLEKVELRDFFKDEARDLESASQNTYQSTIIK